jgi:hypothetical protein
MEMEMGLDPREKESVTTGSRILRGWRDMGMGWDGMGWDGMGWDGMGWDGMGWDGMGWERNGKVGEEMGCYINEKRFIV